MMLTFGETKVTKERFMLQKNLQKCDMLMLIWLSQNWLITKYWIGYSNKALVLKIISFHNA